MAKAELSHNPYLLETIVRFNGQEPKVNCLIEKYQGGKLQSWIKRIPSIFYDEMNGYDFELDFTGTKSDFEDLMEAFTEAGVNTEGREQVRIFHKNELDDVRKKCEGITELLEWLKETAHRKFNYEGFKADNPELFDQVYAYILFHAGNTEDYDFNELNISVENVNSASELENTDLSGTPILFYFDETTRHQCREDLGKVLRRQGIRPEQIFFLIHPSLNRTQIERTIKDLGVCSPQIVFSIDDSIVKKYINNYPVSDYVYNTIAAFSSEGSRIREILDVEIAQCLITGAEIKNKIAELDAGLMRLKDAAERFAQRDNLGIPPEMHKALDKLVLRVNWWKKRKTKITNDEEAARLAKEFDAELQRYFADFMSEVDDVTLNCGIDVSEEFYSWYLETGFDDDYAVESELTPDFDGYNIPAISDDLLDLKEEVYAEQKGKYLKQAADASKSLTRFVTYLYQDWRYKAISVIKPVAEKVIRDRYVILQNYSGELANAYLGHLEDLISQQIQKKADAADQLSDEERELQSDNDFLVLFEDKLREIRRG